MHETASYRLRLCGTAASRRQTAIHEYVVRRLRFIRCNGESIEEQRRIAEVYERSLPIDLQEILAEAALPGPFAL
jgi:hypothetical protein